MTEHEENADKFVWQAGDAVASQCGSCTRFVVGRHGSGCPAFPGGVPAEILADTFDHRRPHPDQVTPDLFTPAPGVSPAALARLARALDALHAPA